MDLTGWTRRRLDNRAVMLTSPDRDILACIEPHVRPVRSLGTWLGELAATIPDLREVCSVGEVHELVTDVGEYAQRISLTTARRFWSLGMIIGEDEAVAIHASSLRSDPALVVDDLLRNHVTPWASERVRMYRYAAPSGWFGTREPWATVWYSATRARIIACDAVPQHSLAIQTRDLLWPVGSETVHTDLNVGRFSIRIQLHDGAAADADVMRSIVESVEPLPDAAACVGPATFDWLVA
jgi:hypothetical protein